MAPSESSVNPGLGGRQGCYRHLYRGLRSRMLKRAEELVAQLIHKIPGLFINLKYLCDLLK
jgi:hypothetical protein